MTVSFSRPLRGLGHIMGWFPSAEALGYFHSSASPTFAAKPSFIDFLGKVLEMYTY